MATRKEFCDGVIEDYENHSVYIGTGNGELVESLTVGQIHKMEETYARRDDKGKPLWNSDTRRDFAFIGKCYDQGYDMSKASAEDCSGLPTHVMRKLGIIKPTADYNCRTFQKACKEVPLKDVQPADLVFNAKIKYDESKKEYVSTASHMGVVTSIENGVVYIIESRGRDYGVVKRPLKDTSFVIGGRLDWFDDDIPILTRNLRYIKDNMMKGKDVKQAQERLNLKGCDAGVEDGIFGIRTYDATILFQTEHSVEIEGKDGLEIDGVIGQKTWAKLWEN